MRHVAAFSPWLQQQDWQGVHKENGPTGVGPKLLLENRGSRPRGLREEVCPS